MDWTGCDLVEVIPGKVSGVPLVVGTRIPADLVLRLVDNYPSMQQLISDYPSLTPGIITGMVAFAQTHQLEQVR